MVLSQVLNHLSLRKISRNAIVDLLQAVFLVISLISSYLIRDDGFHQPADSRFMLVATITFAIGGLLGGPKGHETNRRGAKTLIGLACLISSIVLTTTSANQYGSYDHGGITIWFLMLIGFGLIAQGQLSWGDK